VLLKQDLLAQEVRNRASEAGQPASRAPFPTLFGRMGAWRVGWGTWEVG